MKASEAISGGDRRALARGVTLLEAGGPEGVALLDALWPQVGRARRVGITGPSGAGKSTLVASLLAFFRKRGARVGVIAVDPTSPFTGGALLGDRHRMTREAADEGVFMRSLASRGSLGGLARAAPAALDLLDAAGFDLLMVETVGVGQSEVEVATTADTVAVVLSPESGDGVQAMKAGLLEVADVLCVNKADREGSGELKASLESMLDRCAALSWRPPVVCTNALEGSGARPLLEAIDKHWDWLAADGRLAARRVRCIESRLRRLVKELAAQRLLADAGELLDREAEEVRTGARSVLHAAERVVRELLG